MDCCTQACTVVLTLHISCWLMKTLSTQHEKRMEEFVRAVLQKWLNRDDDNESEESLPCTWDALIQCCEDANLDGIHVFVKQLRGNIPK